MLAQQRRPLHDEPVGDGEQQPARERQVTHAAEALDEHDIGVEQAQQLVEERHVAERDTGTCARNAKKAKQK